MQRAPRRPAPAAGAADPFARYREAVADWDAFQAALSRPLAACVAANTGRIGRQALARLLAAEGLAIEPVGWHPGAFRLPGEPSPGLHWAHRAGLYHVLGEASLLPVRLLAARPGDAVLDLCAAPGGKTAQLALALGGRGTIVANDRDSRRLAALRDAVKRLGLANVTVTDLDGANLPVKAGPFDRVLVDAPCSGEGTLRRRERAYEVAPGDFRGHLARTQRALLGRAVRLVRPGGRVVYATCTFAPEENEAVVEAVLEKFAGAVRIVPPPDLDGLAAAPGLAAWQGRRFHPDLVRAVRLWPHESGTGGFFAVALERTGPADAAHAEAARQPPAAPGRPFDAAPLLARVADRFGLPADAFADLCFFAKGTHAHAVAADHRIPGRLRPVAAGLPLARLDGAAPKLSTAAVLAVCQGATRNAVELDGDRAEAFLRRETVALGAAGRAACDGEGYVLLRRRGYVIGLGYLRAGGRVESLVPKAWAPQGAGAQPP